jgi:hypothetical protein
MVIFERYPHVNDLLKHYISSLNREDVGKMVNEGIKSEEQAELFCRFIWKMVEAINEDEENGVAVLGSADNTEMLPDISYEVTRLMKSSGFYSVWENVSKSEMS